MVPHLDRIREALSRREARLVREREPFASVAMVLAGEAADPLVLFIERAERPGDPWSGHMAFPGGRVETGDRDLRHTAERETDEEVGIDLSSAELLGRLDDVEGRRGGAAGSVFIAGFSYYLEAVPGLTLSHEVEEALWVPTSVLVDEAKRVDYRVDYAPGSWPGIQVGLPDRHIVWGLTYRFVSHFLRRVELTGER